MSNRLMSNLLLSLETSSPICGVALSVGGELLAQAELRIEKSHASHLLPLAENLLKLAGHTLADVGAVALSAGPGSYTGLRIGAASAKGLCAALGIPLLAVSTLQALAQPVIRTTPAATRWAFCPMLDARRQEVFTAIYDADLTARLPETPQVLSVEWLHELLAAAPTVFFGSGAAKCRALLGEHPNAAFLDGIEPTAAAVAQLGTDQWRRQLWEDVAYFEPHYLKEAHTTTPKAALVNQLASPTTRAA